MKQLGLLFGLYIKPLRTMARLLDEGSPLFGGLAVFVVCAFFQFSPLLRLAPPPPPGPTSPSDASKRGQGTAATDVEDYDVEDEAPLPVRSAMSVLGNVVSSGPFGTAVGLAVLYAPTLLFAVALLAPIGGFAIAFRRDFGGLITCVFFVWAAAHLPFALASLVTPYGPLLRVAGTAMFAAMLTPAVQLALGSSLTSSAVGVFTGFAGLLLSPYLSFLASPFLLFYAWAFISGHLSDVEWSLKARRSQRRHLEAATLNPRDAEAHIQLGLIHVRRRQWPEARARFERAMEIEPTDPDARFQLGQLDRRDGRFAEAEKHFIAVIGRDPRFSHHEIWREFGGNYLDAKAYEDARLALERFVSLRPQDAEGLVLLGEALLGLGRTDEAKTRFREAIEAADSTPQYRQYEVKAWRKRAAKQLR